MNTLSMYTQLLPLYMEEECSMYARNPPQPPTSLCNEPYIWHEFLLMTCRNIIMLMSETAERRKIYKSLAEDMLPTELDALQKSQECRDAFLLQAIQ